MNAPRNAWFWGVRPRAGAVVRLFCFHYSGADASVFRGWQDGLPETIEAWPVQLPGHGNRLGEPPFHRIADLAGALREAVLPYLDLPFAFFGHSLGAVVAFELARALADASPCHLFVSGHPAPGQPVRGIRFHDLSDADLVAELRKLDGTPEAVLADPELRQIFLPILRADFELCETYEFKPGPALECPISAYGGLADPYVSRAELETWAGHTSGPFAARMFRGNHFYLNTERDRLVQVLASELITHRSPTCTTTNRKTRPSTW